jgi:hypothetical protein
MPESPVRWRETLGVYVGHWPRIFITCPDAFIGAIVEVCREPGVETDYYLAVNDSAGVPLQTNGSRQFLDFGSVAELKNYWGTVRLTCRPPSQPDATPLTARFIQLPQITLGYVSDPVLPEQALAVSMQGDSRLLASFAGDSDTELLREPETIVLHARMPHISPAVCATSTGLHVAVRVRVPTTRLGLVTEDRGFLGWREPPLTDFDLSAIETGDYLRIELHEEPALEDDRLLCRLVGGDEIAAGRLIAARGPVWQFDVELHRWRDGFGLASGGTIQVRTCSRWVDIVLLREREEPKLPPPQPESVRGQLVAALEEALAGDDRAEARRVAGECRKFIAGTKATAVDRELLLLAVAWASTAASATKDDLEEAARCLEELGARPDLPEAEIIRRTVDLRLSVTQGRGARMSVDEVDRLGSGLPDLPQTILFRAECWYRFCRQVHGSATGGWETCLDYSGHFLARMSGSCRDYRAALLLRAVARLMLAQELDSPWTVSSPTGPTDRLLAGLRLAAQAVRTSRYRLASETIPKPPEEEFSILCPEDVALVRIAIAHASGCPADRVHFAALSGWGREQFFAMNLLRARQATLSGDDLEAGEWYNRVRLEAITSGPDFLLDVEAGEWGKA